MKFETYIKLDTLLNEMGSELNLEAGFTISKKVFKKMKRKYKTLEMFLQRLEDKAKSLNLTLTNQDRYHIKSAWNEV